MSKAKGSGGAKLPQQASKTKRNNSSIFFALCVSNLFWSYVSNLFNLLDPMFQNLFEKSVDESRDWQATEFLLGIDLFVSFLPHRTIFIKIVGNPYLLPILDLRRAPMSFPSGQKISEQDPGSIFSCCIRFWCSEASKYQSKAKN